jgi:alpha-tubulin suppressor-like RCC1 family protein
MKMRSRPSNTPRFGAAALGAITAALVVAGASPGCYAATQVTLTIETDLPCAEHATTAVFIGANAAEAEGNPASATEARCVDGRIGTLALTPTGDHDGRVAVRVVTAATGTAIDTCAAARGVLPTGCIVARRQVGYRSRRALALPIAMRAACRGVYCGESQTCVSGACFDSVIPDLGACEGPQGCSEDVLTVGKTPSGPDASVPDASVPDAGGPDVSVPDASAPCVGCDVTQISAGDTFVCALRTDKRVWCWGNPANGRLGAARLNGLVPEAVPGVDGVTGLWCGNGACAAARAQTGWLFWGKNSTGQVRPGDTEATVLPTAAPLTDLSAVHFGTNHALGKVRNNAHHCWGSNLDWACKDTSTGQHPVSPPLTTPYTSVSAGDRYTCGIDPLGAVECWGNNDSGQLGFDSGGGRSLQAPAVALGGARALHVYASASRTCAVLLGGKAYCWGERNLGGPLAAVGVPVEVTGVTSAKSMAMMRAGSCVLLTSGEVRCWGAGQKGELGNGAANDETLATTKVGLPGPASQITAGESFACALLSDGSVWCWGANTQGELGMGVADASPHPTPQRVVFPK